MKAFIQSFGYALNGIASALRSERNFRMQLAAGVVVCIAGIALNCSPTEWAILFLAIGIVLAAELVNTAIEELTDMVSPDHDPRAGRLKDVAAGAVLVASFAATGVAAAIFGPKLMALASGAAE